MTRTIRMLALYRGCGVPVITHTAGPGPTVVIAGNMHGDETTGLATCLRLDTQLPSTLRRGKVVLYPSLNPDGLRAMTRYFSDGVDLNRCFPGDDSGSASSQAAHHIWTDMMGQQPAAVLDLHADSADAAPYALVDRGVRLGPDRQQLEDAALGLAQATGLLVLWEYPDAEYIRYGMEHSLSGAMLNHHIPAITIEAGPRRMVAHGAVSTVIRAVGEVLASFDMMDPMSTTRWQGPRLRRCAAPTAQSAGVFVPDFAPGAFFDAGEQIGSVLSTSGAVLDRIFAPKAGCVISWAECGWISGRTAVGTLGLEEN